MTTVVQREVLDRFDSCLIGQFGSDTVDHFDRLVSHCDVQPRPYQRRIVTSALQMFAGNFVARGKSASPAASSVLIESPTGSGKTVMGLATASLIQRATGASVGWVAMRRNLLAQLLAITNIKRPVIQFGEVTELLKKYGGEDIQYVDGVVTSMHQPRGGSRSLRIGGDEFRDRFCLETPIDGYGHPRLFLSMPRTVCSNGMIGYARAFRSDIPVGKQMSHCISRAIESYDNGDGYSALRQRFESSQTSWASVRECLLLGVMLDKLGKEQLLTTTGLLPRFRQMAGNLSELYGLANLEALSDKRRRVLPAKCRVYDLLNFSSEVATHPTTPVGAMKMQAYLGTLISDEYDLEGTAESTPDFDAFFIGPKDGLARPSVN